MLQLQNRRSVTLICGVSGSGKSTFALRYLVNVQDVACRFLFDPDGEVSSRLRLPPAATAAELEADLDSGWVVFDPHAMFPGDLASAFRFFCEWSYTVAGRGQGRKILLVDEVWKYCSPLNIPQELALCIQTGRKRGLELVDRYNDLKAQIVEVGGYSNPDWRAYCARIGADVSHNGYDLFC